MAGGLIPVIDMSKTNEEGKERAATMATLAFACQEWGFFQVVNHGIPHGLAERVKRVCKEDYAKYREPHFADSLPAKKLEFALLEAVEAEKIEDVDWEDAFLIRHTHTSIAHGVRSGLYSAAEIEELGKELLKLAERILELMCENLGLEKGYLKAAMAGDANGNEAGPFFGTKISHYPPCPRPDLVMGLRPHTDAGGLILLLQDDDVSGLQLLKEQRWMDILPLPQAIVVDIGDQLEVMTNGKYKSICHRVQPTLHGNRLSIASFYNPSLDAMVYPAPQLVDGNDRSPHAIYPKFLCSDYMALYAQQKYLPKEPRFQAFMHGLPRRA